MVRCRRGQFQLLCDATKGDGGELDQANPPGFLFDIKLHRNLLSSLAKSQAPRVALPAKKKGKPASLPVLKKADLLTYMLSEIEPLIRAKKLGVFLLLLPPYFGPEKSSLEELDLLVERIKPHPLAVEFRNSAWVNPKHRADTFSYFRERGITWVSVDMPKLKHPTIMPPVDEVTQPGLAYLRLHGRNKSYLEAESAEERHTHLYSPKELKEIAARVRRLAAKASEVRVVANNHAQDFAPRTALAIKQMLQGPTVLQ